MQNKFNVENVIAVFTSLAKSLSKLIYTDYTSRRVIVQFQLLLHNVKFYKRF